MQLKLYDTTLRDGLGSRELSLSAGEKLRVAQALDLLGVDFIEAGFPASNPKEAEFFEKLESLPLESATVVAFGMTRRRDLKAEDDPALAVLADCFAPVVTLVGKSWQLHLEKVVKASRQQNLEMISDSISFLRSASKRVFYDAEHFFDGFTDDPDYAVECLIAAVEAGAENITLCDTNGGSLPKDIADITAQVRILLPAAVSLGIHTHNDIGCAVANSLAAVESGADLVQGTVNGYGERCGNANLISLIPTLQLKMNHPLLSSEQLQLLTETSHLVDEISNLPSVANQPYVGRNAFAHKAGMHAAGVDADSRTFEHIQPTLVGNQQEILASEIAGRAAIRQRLEKLGLSGQTDEQQMLQALKEKEHQGYHYEAAPASLELLLRRESGAYQPLFTLESFRILIEKRAGGEVETEATIKLVVDGERHVQIAEGNGPVNALDSALRAAISTYYPQLADIELTNYKVRILDEDHGTSAVTRVLLDASDGTKEWGTTGVSENIIEASWQALVDSLEYAFQS